MTRIFCYFTFTLLLLSPYVSACNYDLNKPFKVLYIVPKDHPDSFWGMHHRFTQTVADSLNIELIVAFSADDERHRFAYVDFVKRHFDENDKPDLVISPFYQGGEISLLSFIEQMQVPLFSYNSSLPSFIVNKIGKPKQRYKHWIGHIAPDDELAGYDLANNLDKSDGRDDSIMVAIAGNRASNVSMNRERGLTIAEADSKFELVPVIHTDWTEKNSAQATKALFSRVDGISAVWLAGGSNITKGAVDYVAQAGLEDIHIGTFDWTPYILEQISYEKIKFSYGGHFTEGGYALMLALDLLVGNNTNSENDYVFKTQLARADINNVLAIQHSISRNWQDIDFIKHSICHNPTLKRSMDFRRMDPLRLFK